MDITEICRKADCDRETLRKAFKKEGFVKLWDKQMKGIVQQARASVLNACIRQAQRGDAAHVKMILTMSGDYNEKHQHKTFRSNPIFELHAEPKILVCLSKDID